MTSVILIMGVAGSGKTTIGKRLAESLGWQFADADHFHSAANVAKMHQGIPLTDADRQPWLLALQATIDHWLQNSMPTVLACSALKAAYRQVLTQGNDRVRVIYLKGSPDLIRQRLQQRQGHYLNPCLLQSQLETLEAPIGGLQVEIDQSPTAIVQAIRDFLTSFLTSREFDDLAKGSRESGSADLADSGNESPARSLQPHSESGEII